MPERERDPAKRFRQRRRVLPSPGSRCEVGEQLTARGRTQPADRVRFRVPSPRLPVAGAAGDDDQADLGSPEPARVSALPGEHGGVVRAVEDEQPWRALLQVPPEQVRGAALTGPRLRQLARPRADAGSQLEEPDRHGLRIRRGHPPRGYAPRGRLPRQPQRDRGLAGAGRACEHVRPPVRRPQQGLQARDQIRPPPQSRWRPSGRRQQGRAGRRRPVHPRAVRRRGRPVRGRGRRVRRRDRTGVLLGRLGDDWLAAPRAPPRRPGPGPAKDGRHHDPRGPRPAPATVPTKVAFTG